MGYSKEVAKGVSFIGFLRITTKAVGFFEALILARILIPSQFGAYGVALLVLGLLEVFTETGTNIFLLQEKHIDNFIDSAWVISIIRGFLIGCLIFIFSRYVALFFHSEESLGLVQLISIVPVIRGFINPGVIMLQKKLLFRTDMFFRLSILIVDTFTSVIVTYITKNPIGIVLGLLTGVVLELFLSFIIIPLRPKLRIKRKQALLILHRGKWVTSAGFFDYLYENVDNIVVGRMLGTAGLGVYQLAYALAVVPINEVGKVFVHVTTPVMINFSDDKKRLSRAYFKTLLLVFMIGIGIAAVFIFFPNLFVLLLGTKWSQIATILPILAILGVVRSLNGTSSAVFIIKKGQKYITAATFIAIFFLLVSIFPLVQAFGLMGAAIAAMIGSIAAVFPIVYFISKFL